MSIAESMITTNNDISEPINYLMWIDDLATFGTRGYVAKDGVKIKELYTKSINLFRNDMAVDEMNKSRQVDKMLNDAEVSAVIQKLAESKTTYVQMTEVIGDTTAMNAVAASTTAMNTIESSSTAKNVLANSPLKQIISSIPATNSWINRRSGKIWLISMKQSQNSSIYKKIGVSPTINGNNIIIATCQQTYNIDYRVDKFLSRLDNYYSEGEIGNVCTYVFIPIS